MDTKRLVPVCALVLATACHHGPLVTAWANGDPGAPPEITEVYRAALDEIFTRDSTAPSLIVVTDVTVPTLVEIDVNAKQPRRRPDGRITPFKYRIPTVFVDTITLASLFDAGRKADSISFTLPTEDPRRYQGFAAPFIERYPGAWGRVIFGRVGLGRARDYAIVEVRYMGVSSSSDYGHELFRLARTPSGWKVVERVPREGFIKPVPLPHRMVHGWVDSASLPPPKRRVLSGTVLDSATGKPVPSFAIRVESVPLNAKGYMVADRFPQPSAIVYTDASGHFALRPPPSGYVVLHATCAPKRDVPGATLATSVLQPEGAIDTVIDFRIRPSMCEELAPAMAAQAEQHNKDVVRANQEAAAKAVQGNLWGTLRDKMTEKPVPRASIRIGSAGGIFFSDSTGRFWLWGFAPGKHELIVRCPVKRQMLGMGKVAGRLNFTARPAMKDTMDISIDASPCVDVPLDTARVRTRGVWSVGFEDGFFTPCKAFDEISLGGYEDRFHLAFLTFAKRDLAPPGGWPKMKPVKGYYKIFLDVDADLIGPGSFGHMGMGTFLLRVTRVRSATMATKHSCAG